MKRLFIFCAILMLSFPSFAQQPTTNNALYFGGDTQTEYVDCGFVLNPSAQSAMSVEAWVNVDAYDAGTFHRVVSQPGTDGGWLNVNNDGTVYTYLGGSYLGTTEIVPATAWTHIAMVWDGSTIYLYINGRLKTSASAGSLTNLTTNMYIGWQNLTNTYFQGMIDEVRIWSTARSATQIRENMMRSLDGTESGLEAYYRFNETTGTTLPDLTSNSHDGTMISMDDTNWVDSETFTTWIGATSTSWSTASNWTDGVPTATDNVGIYQWGGTFEAAISGSPTVNHLVISAGSSPTISSGITVDGNLFLLKNTSLNGQTVTLGNSAYLVEDGAVFYGTTGKITTTRNLSGISGENVAGMGAELTTAANMGSTVIDRTHAERGGNIASSITRSFSITPSNNSGLNATFEFYYATSELNGETEADLLLHKSIDGGTTWTREGGTVNTSENTVTLSGINGFSDWTLSSYLPPVANDTTFYHYYNSSSTSFSVSAPGVLGNDTGGDGDPLTAQLDTDVSSGTLTLNTNGSFTYSFSGLTPDINESFTYYAKDGTTTSDNPATVNLNVLTATFVGPGTSFSDPDNWNGGYVPDEVVDIIIAAGQHLIFDADFTCKSLQFKSGSSFDCDTGFSLTITGNVLNNAGDVAVEVATSIEVTSSISIPDAGI